ncbi:MAG: hypothetical protein ACRC5C_09020 [Bacilli bacterium]
MMSWIGGFIVLGVCTYIGFAFARKLDVRREVIGQLRSAFTQLEAEIVYSHTPLRVAFLHISNAHYSHVSAFFDSVHQRMEEMACTFSDLWSSELMKVQSDWQLKLEDVQVLERLGQTLGSLDRTGEQNQLRILLAHLEQSETNALDDARRFGGAYRQLGVLIGLLLVILLV